MDRELVMWLRAYRPGAVVLMLALVLTLVLDPLQANPLMANAFRLLLWAPIALLCGAVALLGTASYRMWRWARGNGLSCVTCGGPLGHEHIGSDARGGAFRRCYACGKANNHRNYESI